eukprot:TRINITY_DN7737_c0_g1_i1.p1 TRINITY_DN7737_c0_g1~~TRINITY_DN7737_c0_g1_i1.p1  ORF type:complete len:369 (+),score=116.01 TRINITY_DN7737_c0_g1_i1:71-1108(+)
MKVLVAGGAGYIGSHVCVELLLANHQVVVVDSLANSSFESLQRVKTITNRDLAFYQADIRDGKKLDAVFAEHGDITAVINLAGLKAVGDSVRDPLQYFDVNFYGAICLFQAMQRANVKTLVFSSSATVYGDPKELPLTENSELCPTNPYGRTKLMIEQALNDLFHSTKDWKIMILRYFNPVGSHKSGMLGEDPLGVPNNLFPMVTQVAIGRRPMIQVFGRDYETHDGTGIRDYLHVTDLARGHVAAIKSLHDKEPRIEVLNLGRGKGYSVLDILKAMSKEVGFEINHKIVDRRPGDVPILCADSSKAQNELGWECEFDLEDMCRDAWRWQTQNPNGFHKSDSKNE